MYIITQPFRKQIYNSLFKPILIPFCTKKTKMNQLYSMLMSHHNQLQIDKTVKLMHLLHLKSSSTPTGTLLTPLTLDTILPNLISSIHMLNHEYLTLLLEVITDILGYQLYNRDNPFMRGLFKRFNFIQSLALNTQYIFRFLHLLDKMQFPHIVINKYLKSVKIHCKNQKMNCLDTLRFFILVLELPYVHPKIVFQFYIDLVAEIKAKSPKQLTYLYYIYNSVIKSLNKKINYCTDKIKFNKLVLSPSPSTQDINNTDSQPNNQINQTKRTADELIKQIKQEINVQIIKKQIIRHFGFEKYPFDSSIALFLVEIKQLQADLIGFFKNNYEILKVIEFGSLLGLLPLKQRLQFYEKYMERAQKYMNIKQKISMLNIRLKLCEVPPTKQEILKILPINGSLTLKQFQVITVMVARNLQSEQQLHVIEAIDSLLGLNDESHDKSDN